MPNSPKLGKQFRLELSDETTKKTFFYECWIEKALKSSDSYSIAGRFGVVGESAQEKVFGISGMESCLKRAAALKETRQYSGYNEVA